MKMKRIFSLLLVLFLLGLYLITFIVSIFTTKETGGLFMACIFSTFIIPIMLYGYQVLMKAISKRSDDIPEEIHDEKQQESKK